MAIKPDQVVTVHFTLKDESGTTLEVADKNQPYSFISGRDQILPKLEEKISTMLINSKGTVELLPEDAYGEFEENAIQKASRADFPEDLELEEGMNFMADMGDGKQLPFFIKEIENDEITIDFNHPLAGKSLTFDLELVDVRDASPEELAHGHVHGAGGHHH
ncbi:MAG: peptidylprolyl isomerase [Calditrichaceae bacterium]